MITEAQEFAEKYAGREVRPSIFPIKIIKNISNYNQAVAIVIGYALNSVIISFDRICADAGWKISQWYRSKYVFLIDAKYGWCCNVKDLELIDNRPLARTHGLISIYTKKCSYCKSPARKISELTLCSNSKCQKSNLALRKAIGYYKYMLSK